MRGSLARSADDPDSVMAPGSSTKARLAISSAIAEFCSISNTPSFVRLLSSTIRSNTCSITIGARPSEGSSSIRRLGRPIRARPIASICCSPPDSDQPPCLSRSFSRGNRSNTSARSSSTSVLFRAREAVPVIRFSRTVSPGKIRRPSGQWARPEPTMSSTAAFWIGSPFQEIVPAVGRTSPEMVESVVVLPAPLPPIRATISPISTLNEMPLSTSIWPYDTRRSSILSMAVPPAEIGLDHLRIALDVRRRALGDLLAEVEHRDAVADAHHQPNIVLDQQYSDAAALERSDGIEQRHALGHVHAGGRFVEQKHRRFRCQRAGDLQKTALRVGQLRGAVVSPMDKPNRIECLSRGRVDIRFALPVPRIR